MSNSTDNLRYRLAMAKPGEIVHATEEEIKQLNGESVVEITGISSDGSTASYYELPIGALQLQDLISYKDMNAQMGEIFRENYRYGQAGHCDKKRGIKKILFYAQAELERLIKKEHKGEEAPTEEEPITSFSHWGLYELPEHTIESFLKSDAPENATISFTKAELNAAIIKAVLIAANQAEE